MDHGLHLVKRHLGNVNPDIWIRPEQLEGGWDGIQVHGVGWRDGHGRCGMAGGTGREVGVPCCRDGHGCGDWVSTGLIVRNNSVTAMCREYQQERYHGRNKRGHGEICVIMLCGQAILESPHEVLPPSNRYDILRYDIFERRA
jgi:hypothetical protein